MYTVKTALISPAIDAINAPSSPEDQQHIFEQKFSEMAYSTFSTRFPDLVNSIVTFKVLDADMEKSVAVGAFIIEEDGEYIYVPAVLADNGLKPFDVMYIKSKDMFVPLTNEWLEEVRRTTLSTLGEGAKLPDTVATDVDIRNVMIPPTTGRYSYASAKITPHIRLAAESTEPLGRKLANMMPEFPAEQSAPADPNAFNHELWATFVDQYNRLNGTTPGQALDQGMMDIDTMSKMYKSHVKTWSDDTAPVKQAYDYRTLGSSVDDLSAMLGRGAAFGAGAGALNAASDFELADVPGSALRGALGGAIAAPIGRMVGRGVAHDISRPRSQAKLDKGRDIGSALGGLTGGYLASRTPPDTISELTQPSPAEWAEYYQKYPAAQKYGYDYKTLGQSVDNLSAVLGRGAAFGAGAGALNAASDFELADVPGSALRGAIGGALAAPIGRAIGRGIAHDRGRPRTQAKLDKGQSIGTGVAGLTGGYLASRTPPDTISELTRPSPAAWAEYYQQHPPPGAEYGYPGMSRTGADYNEGLKAMVKHAQAARGAAPKQLISFLTRAPNNIKQAFASLLQKDKRILKTAAELYGEKALISALTLRKKTAGMSMSGGALYVADKDTTPKSYAESFGSDAATAFNGVLLRGYYYKDKRPSLNLAVQVQEYHDFQQANASGVYRLYDLEGKAEPALVVTDPINLMTEDSDFFPKEKRLLRIKNRLPRGDEDREPGNTREESAMDFPKPEIERSHKTMHLAIFGNGDYILCNHVAGEQVTEVFLKGTPLYNKVMRGEGGSPAAGKGVFVHKRGEHYFATEPVELSSVTDNTTGVRGKLTSLGGMTRKTFVIDKRSPINRVMRPRGENLVVIPNNWKWLPLKEKRSSSDYLHNMSALTSVVMDALGSMGASKAVVRDAGQSQFTVDGKTTDKAASLRHIATKYRIPARDAEAMLKIAAHTGRAEAFVISPKQFRVLRAFEKQAQGQLMPEGEMAPANAPSSSIDQAFSEAMGALNSQVEQIQAQLSVLQQVQQRAMQIDGEQSGMPVDPSMQDPSMQGQQMDPSMQDPSMQDPSMQGQQMDPSMQDPSMQGQQMDPSMQDPSMQDPSMQGQQMDPSMQGQQMDPSMQGQQMDPSMQGQQMDPSMQGQQMDPSMQGQQMDPSMQDPSMQGEESALPVMYTESPSAQEIEQQINPDFLAQAGELQETGAFDAGAIASLAKAPSFQGATSDYASGMESTLDDLGRTLLTLYMQEPDLKEQLGEESFVKLETQLRDNFKGLGALLVSMTHQSPLLSNRDEN